MFNNRSAPGGILLAAALLLLGACGTKAPVSPTPDANAIYTAAAQTIEVSYTQTAVAMPTETPAPTSTPSIAATQSLPTLPPISSNGGTNNSNGTPKATNSFQSTAKPIQAGAATAALQPGVTSGDKAQWVANKPADGAQVPAGAKFDLTWTIKNIGTTTWTKDYSVRFFYGTKVGETTQYNFSKEVKPGDTLNILVDAVAPSTTGEYHTWWKLTNQNGVNFGDVDLTFKIGTVVATTTPTP